MDDTIYKFVGEGAGVPGLPHTINVTQALELGVMDILKGAIANGNYIEAFDQVGDTVTPTVGAIELSDGVSDAEASLAGKALRKRR